MDRSEALGTLQRMWEGDGLAPTVNGVTQYGSVKAVMQDVHRERCRVEGCSPDDPRCMIAHWLQAIPILLETPPGLVEQIQKVKQRQSETWGVPKDATPGEWRLAFCRLLFRDESEDRVRFTMRDIAALALSAVEEFDRIHQEQEANLPRAWSSAGGM